jgi:hypothetical protein
MMQVYKAKTSRRSKGEYRWVVGYTVPMEALTKSYEDNRINEFYCKIINESAATTEVQISTLCRYTEIDYKDQNVFENDVIREWVKDDQEPGGGAWSYSVIKMHQGSWCVCGINYEYSEPEPLWDRLGEDFEIYGSLLDHPELVNNGTQPSDRLQ